MGYEKTLNKLRLYGYVSTVNRLRGYKYKIANLKKKKIRKT